MFKTSNTCAIIALPDLDDTSIVNLYEWDHENTKLIEKSINLVRFNTYNPDFIDSQDSFGEDRVLIEKTVELQDEYDSSIHKNVYVRFNNIDNKIEASGSNDILFSCTGSIINKENLGLINNKPVKKICTNANKLHNDVAVLTENGEVYFVSEFDSSKSNLSNNKVQLPDNTEVIDIDCTRGPFYILTNNGELFNVTFNDNLQNMVVNKVMNILPVKSVNCHLFRCIILCIDDNIYASDLNDHYQGFTKIDLFDDIKPDVIKSDGYTIYVKDTLNNLYSLSINEWGSISKELNKFKHSVNISAPRFLNTKSSRS